MRLIDADALNDKLENLKIENIKNKYTAIEGFEEVFKVIEGYSFAQIVLRDAPTIDPASLRPKGEWKGWHGDKMVAEDTWRHYHYYQCSECYKNTAVKSNFCPNCGCQMGGE